MIVAMGTEVTAGAKAAARVSTVRSVVTPKTVAPMVWSVRAVTAKMMPSRVVNRTNPNVVSVSESMGYVGRKQSSLTLVRMDVTGPRIYSQGNCENENLFCDHLFHSALPRGGNALQAGSFSPVQLIERRLSFSPVDVCQLFRCDYQTRI